MTNKEFQIQLDEMYNKYSMIRNRKQKILNELVYVLRMTGEDYQLTVTEDGIPNGCSCIPGVQDVYIPVKDLTKKVVSVEFDEETYNDFGIKLLLVKVED